MSDLNLNYYSLKNMTQTQRNEFTLSNIKPSGDDDTNLNQSIFKAYLDTLREKSDEATQKTLKELENTPISAVNKLFGNLQVNSVEQVSKIFDDLRIKPTDELDSILGNMKTGAAEQVRSKAADLIQKKTAADKTDKSDNTQAEKAAEKERFLDKYLKHTSEKMSKENNTLNKDSESVSEAAQRITDAIKRSDETGERDRDELRDAAEDFVSRYNTFADTVNASKNNTVSGKAKFIDEMTDAYSSRLEKVGITRGEDGKLNLDKEKLDKADDRDIERALGKEDSFADFIDNQAKQLASYAQTDLYQNASAYNDGGNITQVSNISGSYFNMLG